MMPWIELHDTVFGHRKTRKMARLLDMACVPLSGHLSAIWCWALDKTTDGRIAEHSIADMEEAAEWDGEPGAFIAAMVASGYMDEENGFLILHDWTDYAGRYIEKKTGNAERQRRWRERAKEARSIVTESNAESRDSNALVTQKTLRNAPTNQPTNQPIQDSVESGDSPDGEPTLFSNNGGDYPADFIKWWEGYPKKIDKAGCLKLYRTQKKKLGTGATATLLTARDNYIASLTDMKYAVKPEKFLSTGHSYIDEWEKADNGGVIRGKLPDDMDLEGD